MTTIKLGGSPYEGSAAECFMDKLKAMSNSHPLDPQAVILDNCSVLARPSNGNRTIHISAMDSLIRGSGSIALQKLCDLADECEIELSLIAFGYADTPTKKLVEWYSRYGFVSGMGNNKDGFRMRREPKAKPIKLLGFKRLH